MTLERKTKRKYNIHTYIHKYNHKYGNLFEKALHVQTSNCWCVSKSCQLKSFIENASSEMHYNLMWMQYAFIVTFPKNVLLLTSQQIRIKLKHFNLNVSKMVSMWTQHYSQLSYSIVLHLIETICFQLFRVVDFFLIFGVERHFQQYFSYIMAMSFSGGRSRSKWREPPTIVKQLVNFITSGCESSAICL